MGQWAELESKVHANLQTKEEKRLARHHFEKISPKFEVINMLGFSSHQDLELRSSAWVAKELQPKGTDPLRVVRIVPETRVKLYGFDPRRNRDEFINLKLSGAPALYTHIAITNNSGAITDTLFPMEYDPDSVSCRNIKLHPSCVIPYAIGIVQIAKQAIDRGYAHMDEKPSNWLAQPFILEGERKIRLSQMPFHVGKLVVVDKPTITDWETLTVIGQPIRWYSEGFSHPQIQELMGTDKQILALQKAECFGIIQGAIQIAPEEMHDERPFIEMRQMAHDYIDDPYTDDWGIERLLNALRYKEIGRRKFIKTMKVGGIAAAVACVPLGGYLRHQWLVDNTDNKILEAFDESPESERALFNALSLRKELDVKKGKGPSLDAANPEVSIRMLPNGSTDPNHIKWEPGGETTELNFEAAKSRPFLYGIALACAHAQLTAFQQQPKRERLRPGEGTNLNVRSLWTAIQHEDNKNVQLYLDMIREVGDHVLEYVHADKDNIVYPYARGKTFTNRQNPDRIAADDMKVVYQSLRAASRALRFKNESVASDEYLEEMIRHCDQIPRLMYNGLVRREILWASDEEHLTRPIDDRPMGRAQAIAARALIETAQQIREVSAIQYGKKEKSFTALALALTKPFLRASIPQYYLDDPVSSVNPIATDVGAMMYENAKDLGLAPNGLAKELVKYVPREKVNFISTERKNIGLLTNNCLSLDSDVREFWCTGVPISTPGADRAFLRALSRAV